MKNLFAALIVIAGMALVIWATTSKKQVERTDSPAPRPIGPAAYPKTEAETLAENTFNILQPPGTFFTQTRVGV